MPSVLNIAGGPCKPGFGLSGAFFSQKLTIVQAGSSVSIHLGRRILSPSAAIVSDESC